MLFDFFLKPERPSSTNEVLAVGARQVPVVLIRNPRARRYLLRLQPDGSARVTIPRGGSEAEGRRFAERNREWLERQFERRAGCPERPKEWRIGTEILFRGGSAKLVAGANGESGVIHFGEEAVKAKNPAGDLRPAIDKHLWRLAAQELPPRVLEYAALHQLRVRRITVRNQKSRWGSCSRRGTISLNWRLIQAPEFVRDYIILHELMHLRQMNHSVRFWREVEQVCPDYKTAESWLRKHSFLLR